MPQFDTYRNLLAGLLALNQEWIGPAALVRALSEWGQDRSRSICDILVAAGQLEASRRQDVEIQCDDHLRRYGDDPDLGFGVLSVSDSLRADLLQLADPEISVVISRSLSKTAKQDPYATRHSRGTDTVPPAPPTDPLLTPTDDATITGPQSTAGRTGSQSSDRYRVLRLYAKGGLGLVSVAQDHELKREVALKEIQAGHANDVGCRERFLAEAEITARLEHPGVVPVYGLGQYGDGRPYYAMRFIRGKSLREAIAEYYVGDSRGGEDSAAREVAFRGLLGNFIAVCNTIEYSHSRQILHRDLKPSNVMLGDYGETLVVDWGLAVSFNQVGLADRPAEPAGDPNETGTAIGTPQYMSPEQGAGRVWELGPATDIYSLGASLYELLTGQLPFDRSNYEELMKCVATGKFPPPRTRRPACPPALEAICLKAMSLRPEDRYPSARALARDVEQWLADEPVSVYREPLSQRVARWTRRHRAATQATVAGLIVTIAVALLATVFINGARQREAAARVEATDRSRQARDVIDTLLEKVATDLKKYPGMQDARRRLLERAAQDYEKLTQANSSDPELRAEAARSFDRLGDVRALLNQFGEADSAYRSEAALWVQLRREFPHRREYSIAYANSITQRAILLASQGSAVDAVTAFQASLAELAPLFKAHPEDPDAASAIGTVLVNLGRAQIECGRQSEADASLQQAVSVYEALGSRADATPSQRSSAAIARNALGKFFISRGREPEAISLFRKSEETFELLAETYPQELAYRSERAATRLHLAAALRDKGNSVAEADIYLFAVDDLRKVLSAEPDVPLYRENLAVTLTNLGQALHSLGQNEQAAEELDRSWHEFEDLANEYPAVPSYLEGLATASTTLASVWRELAKFDDAAKMAGRGIESYQQLVTALPDVPRYRAGFGVALGHQARIHVQTAAVADAEQEFEHSVSELKHASLAEPLDPHFRENLATVLSQRAWFRRQTGDLAASRDYQQQALEILGRLTDDYPRTARFQDSLARQLTTGPGDELQDFPRAAKLAAHATELAPENRFFWQTLGAVRYRLQDWAGARAALQRADELRPAEAGFGACLQAMVEWQLGNRDAARALLEEAQTWSEKNRPGDEELSRFRDEAGKLISEQPPSGP